MKITMVNSGLKELIVELLTQFLALNEEKYGYLQNINISTITLLTDHLQQITLLIIVAFSWLENVLKTLTNVLVR